MKKNKLTFTAGILMVIVASISIALAIEYSVLFANCVNRLAPDPEGLPNDNVFLVFDAMLYLGLAIISITESILYMIWGVKLIKKTGRGVQVVKMKKWLITMMVFSYIFALLHLESLLDVISEGGLFLAIAIILNVAVTRGDAKGSVNPNTNYKGTSIDENVIERMASIKKLKEDGVISEEEYNQLRDKILGEIINTSNDTQDN